MSHAPLEIKELAVRLFKSGKYKQPAISAIVGYSVAAIKRWVAKDRQGLPLTAPERGHNPRKLNDCDREAIRQLFARKPDATIEDVRKTLNYKASKSAVHREMIELGYTYKKNETRQRARKRRRPDETDELGRVDGNLRG